MPVASSSKKAPSEGASGGGGGVESWIEKIVDGEEGSVPRQVFLGGVSGWLTGFVAMKVGKAAATAIGGGILLLQLASYKGYININWNRLNRDVERIGQQIQDKNGGGVKKDWSNKLENKLMKAADKAEGMVNRGETVSRRWYHKLTTGEDLRLKDLQVFTASFTAGVGLGVVCGT